MNLIQTLKKHQFPPELIDLFRKTGITDLYAPQAEAIRTGVLEGQNLLMSVPTAAGKTLIAELAMLKAILTRDGRCLYIAPLKALASEKYHHFKKSYAPLGVKVGLAIGDADTPVRSLNSFQILVATAEKVDSLMRTQHQSFVQSLQVVVFDEIHFINDGSRGPTMEILASRIRQLNPEIQTIALSATISNAKELAAWLKAKAVVSDWRPIPLKEGVYLNERILFDTGSTKMIAEDAKEDLAKLCLDTLRGKGQVLIFVNSRRSTQAVCRRIAKDISKVLSPAEKTKLKYIAGQVLGTPLTTTKVCQKLANVIPLGVAFHHAGLKPHQRTLIEDNFRKNLIKVICCTPTLAAGVNLPARRAVIRDIKRFEMGLGSAYIPTSEYKQCAGRAGRPQYDEYGEAIIMAKTFSESDVLFERYIHAHPEPIISKLDKESSLRIHVLASIAAGYVHDMEGMYEFISHTFLYQQKKSQALFALIEDIFAFLKNEQFIDKSGSKYFATVLGSLTSRLYIDPLSTIVIRDGLRSIHSPQQVSAVGILHLLTCCPDSTNLKGINKNTIESLESFSAQNKNRFILTPENTPSIEDLYTYLSTIKTTYLLNSWIDEAKEDIMCDTFNVGPGDIYRIIENTQWLLYAAGSVAHLMREKKLTFFMENLRKRMRYGVKEELLGLTSIRNIGRVRARILYGRGYKSLRDLQSAPQEKLSAIKQIGPSLAAKIQSYV
jgi:helicase